MSDNEEDVGINKWVWEDGEEEKYIEVNKEYNYDVEELEDNVEMHEE